MSDLVGESGGFPAEVLTERLAWLNRLRWGAVAGMLVAAGGARWAVGLGIHVWAIAALAAVVAGYNALLTVWVHRRGRGDCGQRGDCRSVRRVANAQIALDLLVLTLVLHFAGGVANPFGIFMVFHMAIAAILLRRRDAFFQAAWGAALYVALGLVGLARPMWQSVAGFAPADVTSGTALIAQPLVVLGRCGAVAVSLLLIVYFTGEISRQLRLAYVELAEANNELSTLEHTKSRFLRVASHQLRSPIAAIHSVLSAVQSTGENLTDSQKRLLGRVKARAEQMVELLNEMLTLSEVKESPTDQHRREPIDLPGLLKKVTELHAQAAADKKIELTLDVRDAATVLAWPEALDDVFGNLVNNAVKYTPDGGQAAVTCRRDGPWAVVDVADTGIGIPAESQKNMFSEFYRAGNAKKFAGGTGLGLNIVKEIVERLGGQISFTSVENEGTTFTVKLPAAG